MAQRNSNTVKSSNGKQYSYKRITRKVGMKQNKLGEWIPDYKTFSGKTKKECEEKYQAYISSSALSRDKTFGELLSDWLENVYMLDDSLTSNTKALHTNSFYSIFGSSSLLAKKVESLRGSDFQKVLNASKIAPTSKRHARTLLHRFYLYLISEGVTDTDCTVAIVVPKPEKKSDNEEIETFTDEEIRKFIDETPQERLRLLVLLLIFTGCRIGEIRGLKYSDFENGMVKIQRASKEVAPSVVGKEKRKIEVSDTKTTSSVRSIPLEPYDFFKREIEAHKQWHTKEMLKFGYRTDYCFTTASGNLYDPKNLSRAFERLCKALGIEPKSFHVFRHTFASKLAKEGVPIQEVARLLGHEPNTCMKYYVNVDSESKREAVKKLVY